MMEAIGAASASRDVDECERLNFAFHDRMVELVGNGTPLETYRRLVNELTLYRREALPAVPTAVPVVTRAHRDIVSAIASRDPALAGRLMREHVERGRARLHDAVQATPMPTRVRAPSDFIPLRAPSLGGAPLDRYASLSTGSSTCPTLSTPRRQARRGASSLRKTSSLEAATAASALRAPRPR